jgi:hypothetical protein
VAEETYLTDRKQRGKVPATYFLQAGSTSQSFHHLPKQFCRLRAESSTNEPVSDLSHTNHNTPSSFLLVYSQED